MAKGNILDFQQQADQLLAVIQPILGKKDTRAASRLCMLKLQAMYALGVSAGKRYEKEGVSPYLPAD